MSFILQRLMGASKPARPYVPAKPFREPTRGEERRAEAEWRASPR